MWLLAYNRKLAWVVVPAAVWAVLGLSLALGVPGPGSGPGGIYFGAPDGGLWLRGQLVSLSEQDDGLHITLAVPPDSPPIEELPDRLYIETVAAGPETMHETPAIDLPDQRQIMRLRGNRAIVLTEDFVVRFGRGDLRIAPRPAKLRGELARRWLEQQRQREDGPGGRGPRRPGRKGMGEGPPGPPGEEPPGEMPPGWSGNDSPPPLEEGIPWGHGEKPPGEMPPPDGDQPSPAGGQPPPDDA